VKARLLAFIDSLRDAGLPITVAEALDAMRAVSAVGIERAGLREALAATLIKDEADRPVFDAVFDRFFAVAGRQRGKQGPRQPTPQGAGRGSGGSEGSLSPSQLRERPEQEPQPKEAADRQRSETAKAEQPGEGRQRLARNRALLTKPFHEMSPPEIEACTALMAELAQRFRAYLLRRQRTARRGRLDVRRTIRRSISKGGTPIDPAFRQRRPGRPDLVALCDYSYSVATASRFMLALLAPAHAFFRRLRLFAYVDRPVEVSIESGVFVPHEHLDRYARSDLGNVLVRFWERHESLLTRNTLLLILGDARNNRRPPRAEVVGRMHGSVQQVIWLNPELPERWNAGDSTMRTYQQHCDVVIAAASVQQLYAALQRSLRTL